MIQPTTIQVIRRYQSTRVRLRMKYIQRDQYVELQAKCDSKKQTTYQKRIDSVTNEIKALERTKRRLDRLLSDIKREIEGNWFNVYYYHVVRGLSLRETAQRTHYSKAGVCKILKTIRKRVDRQ